MFSPHQTNFGLQATCQNERPQDALRVTDRRIWAKAPSATSATTHVPQVQDETL
jgi:hypothetical protein